MSDLPSPILTPIARWIKIRLFRRYIEVGGVMQTYTMGVQKLDTINYLAFFAHVEPGRVQALPDFTKGELEVKLMKMTSGVLTTYGYVRGRGVWYNLVTHELKERSK